MSEGWCVWRVAGGGRGEGKRRAEESRGRKQRKRAERLERRRSLEQPLSFFSSGSLSLFDLLSLGAFRVVGVC